MGSFHPLLARFRAAVGPAARTSAKWTLYVMVPLLAARWAVYGVTSVGVALAALGAVAAFVFVVAYLGSLAGVRE